MAPHPPMFDEDDPYLRRVRELAQALPGADMKVSHGRPAFFTKKVFAYYGGSLKVDGDWVQHEHSLTILPDPDDRRVNLVRLTPAGRELLARAERVYYSRVGEVMAALPADDLRRLCGMLERIRSRLRGEGNK